MFFTIFHPAILEPKTVKEWKQILESPRVVATTCMGISHVVFSKRTFDLVGSYRSYIFPRVNHCCSHIVVDEAGQIAEPVCLGPLRMAKGRFILVGDPFQLAPLMRASKWKDSVESLFERLCVVGLFFDCFVPKLFSDCGNDFYRNIQKQSSPYANNIEWPTILCNLVISSFTLTSCNVQMKKLPIVVLHCLQVGVSLFCVTSSMKPATR